MHVDTGAGPLHQLADGGFTTWTRQLLGNAKERLLVSGLGVELLLGLRDPAGRDRLSTPDDCPRSAGPGQPAR